MSTKDGDNRPPRPTHQKEASDALQELLVYAVPLSPSDTVLVMQGWNKALAFKTAFSEALLLRWRILVATQENNGSISAGIRDVEKRNDPIGVALNERLFDAEELLIGLLDGAIRSLCPKYQKVEREAYRAIADNVELLKVRGEEEGLSLECLSVEDHLRLFARVGVSPDNWVIFCEAFVWTMKTHVPYAQEDDKDDLARGTASAMARAVAQHVAVPAIKQIEVLKSWADNPVYQKVLPELWGTLTKQDKADFGEAFYRTLLTKHPQLLDYFSKTDMDSLSLHLMMALDLVVASVGDLGTVDTSFRAALNHLGGIHRRMGVPTYSYALVGANLIDNLQPVFRAAEKANPRIKVAEYTKVFTDLYMEVMSIVYYPMLRQEKLSAKAREFYKTLQPEFKWSDATLEGRILEIETEIAATGRYTHTSEELQMGARIAWRNSAKCIGRIAWNTLLVRDCRHIDDPSAIFKEVHEHQRIATAGTNIQSVMTVFKPKKNDDPLGTRFWSSQFVRYAAYKDKNTGTIMGDPANLDLTEFLLERNWWTPPEPKSPFDVLPLVLKVPGVEKPYIHQLPSELFVEVKLEHPTTAAFANLGYKWSTVPAITNFKMNLGGIVYQNIPFNGWFVSTEIVRNIMERYDDANEKIADCFGIDRKTNPVWRQSVAVELEHAVLYSFRKGGYTIVDPHSVGESFCTHVRREREKFDRECPGQWSWIGGLVGPTNPTWHLEMRDFLLLPQYEYCADGLLLHTNDAVYFNGSAGATETTASETISLIASAARPLILYGSETGNAEAVSRRLKRELALLKPILMSLDDVLGFEVVKKRAITHVLCVCSTFGKGEAPSNATRFFADELPPVADVSFAVLALGSTLYPDFCQAGIKLDRKLSKAGLARVCTLAKADEASDADATISGWLKMIKSMLIPPSLEAELIMYREMSLDDEPVNVFKWEGNRTEHVLPLDYESMGSLCVGNIDLLDSSLAGTKSIRKISFLVPHDSSYESGDHLSVQPVNSKKKVERFLRCFEVELEGYAKASNYNGNDAIIWQAQMPFEIRCIEGDQDLPADAFFKMPTTLWHLSERQLDFNLGTNTTPDVLRMLKEAIDHVINELDEREAGAVLSHPMVQEFLSSAEPILSTKAGTDHTEVIDDFVAVFPTVVDCFEHYRKLFFDNFIESVLGKAGYGPIVQLPELLLVLPRLQPRFYSISSSNRANPNEVSITVGVLKTTSSRGVRIEGICSNYLAGLVPNKDRAEIAIRKSTFRLPTKLSSPLIMVGAGTGLAPMMGFLEDRALDVAAQGQASLGEVHLFFGCRTEADFTYEDIIRGYEKRGLLSLHLALSRSRNAPKKYVQNCIKDMGEKACELLMDHDTHYYVCGDAKMADECYEACIDVLCIHNSMSRVAAVQHLKKMRIEGRWQTDVWGIVSHFAEAKKVIAKSKKTAAKVWLTHFNKSKEEDSATFDTSARSIENGFSIPAFGIELSSVQENREMRTKTPGRNDGKGVPDQASNGCYGCIIL